jgi:hypothetical protein
VANSNTELCNLALIELGQARITSLATDQNETAKLCRDKWPQVRDAVLRGADWRCLIKRTALAREAATPAFGYLYQYALPVDYFRMLSFSVEGAAWAIEGRLLLTDEESASIRYVGYDRAADPVALFDPLLTTVLVEQLAAMIAPSLKSADRVAELWALRHQAFSEAVRTGAVEVSRAIASCTSLTTSVR